MSIFEEDSKKEDMLAVGDVPEIAPQLQIPDKGVRKDETPSIHVINGALEELIHQEEEENNPEIDRERSPTIH